MTLPLWTLLALLPLLPVCLLVRSVGRYSARFPLLQLSGEKLITRKVALILRVVDPLRVTNALTGLYQVSTAVGYLFPLD